MKNRNYRLLTMSDVINRFGDSIDAVVFAWLAYSLTEDASFSVLVYALNRIPTVLLMPFAGAFVEKRKKHMIMIVSDLSRAFLVGYVVLQLCTGTLAAFELLIVTFLISCCETVRQPASRCMIPLIVEQDDLDEAISCNASLSTMAELAGTACAAMIIGLIGNTGAMCVDIATFIFSALFLGMLKVNESFCTSSDANVITDMKQGMQIVKNDRVILYLLAVSLFLNGLFVPYNSLEAAFIAEVMKGDELVLSLSGMASGIGMIIGSSMYPAISKHIKKRAVFLSSAIMLTMIYLCSVGISLIPVYEIRIGLFTILMFFVSITLGAYNVCTQVTVVSQCKGEYLARVSSLMYASAQALTPLLSFAVSGIVKCMSVTELFLISGVIMIIGDMLLFRKKVMPDALQK